MRALGSLLALLLAVLSAGASAADEYRNRWEVEGWYGYDLFTNGVYQACNAVYEFGPSLAFRLTRIPELPASSFELWDSTVGVDLSAIADLGASVTVTVGSTQRVYKVHDSASMFVEIIPQPDIVELLAAGGPASFKLPNGKVYSFRLPPAPTAMANYKKCMESNRVR